MMGEKCDAGMLEYSVQLRLVSDLQARAAAWLPELPPKAAAGSSPYINEILDFLTVRAIPA
jgi:hypothetical protein